MTYFWKLNFEQARLAAKVFIGEEGIMYIDADGELHEKDGGDFDQVDSRYFDTLEIFIFEIETTRLIVNLRKGSVRTH